MILDQYPLWLEAVEPILTRIGVTVVGKTTRPEEALALVEEWRPDMLIAEISTAEGTAAGIACICEVRERAPEVKVIVLAASSETQDLDAAFDAGAAAYIIKTSHPDDIATTIRQAFNHSVFFARPTPDAAAPAPPAVVALSDAAPALTRRETEILRLVAEGYSNGQLARMLWVTEQTVKFHLSNIYRKLEVRNRTEASRWAQLNGLVSTTRQASVA